jgi:dTDP-4-amino-4,6-dideoxygalactose transaminase
LPFFGSDAGEIEVFSLHATKTFAIGEGGVIFAPLDRVEAIRKRLNFGFEADRTYFRGTNGKMDELHAALALAQLDRIEEMQAVREMHARRYDAFFSPIAGVQIPTGVAPGSGWTMYPIISSGYSATDVIAKALEHGIETKRYYWPTVSTAARDYIARPVNLDVSERIANSIICFPIYSVNSRHLVDGLFEALNSLYSWELEPKRPSVRTELLDLPNLTAA